MSAVDHVPPTRGALQEALALSDTILRNIELSEIPLVNIALKASRLARLLNDFESQKIMEYEASGYPSTPDGVPTDVFGLAIKAGREIKEKDKKSGETLQKVYLTSIEQLEHEVQLAETSLSAARDPDVSVTSANPSQWVASPAGNAAERSRVRINSNQAKSRLSARRSFIYAYALRRHHELKFSGIADDIFSRIREAVDTAIGDRVPDAVQKLSAVYANLNSENPEDWSNAVHSCRRVLQDLADAIYPARDDKVIEVDGNKKPIKLGPDNYINRLVAFIEENSTSERYQEIVGSHLSFVGDRLDSVFAAAQKGSHATILTRQEADRYVVYTYLLVGDILSLIA
jgi:hypothetical protein